MKGDRIALLASPEEDSSEAKGSQTPSVWKLRAQGFGAAIVLALVVGLLVVVASSDDGGLFDELDPGIAPAEFLYLDNVRVAAYLAQLEGGAARSERLSRTLTRDVSGKATAGGAFEVGASAQEERFIEREVTPTAASNYFRLFDALEDAEDPSVRLRWVDDPRNYEALARLHEGDFVGLSTRDLLRQDYIKPYLVVRQPSTLAALFPLAGGPAARSSASSPGPSPARWGRTQGSPSSSMRLSPPGPRTGR